MTSQEEIKKKNWTKERKVQYYENKIKEIDIKLMLLQSKMNGYIFELRQLRYDKEVSQ